MAYDVVIVMCEGCGATSKLFASISWISTICGTKEGSEFRRESARPPPADGKRGGGKRTVSPFSSCGNIAVIYFPAVFTLRALASASEAERALFRR